MTKLISTNPARNYEVVGSVDISTDAEIEEKVKQANAAKTAWKELGVRKRIELLKPICDEFEKRKEEIANLITREMGKLIKDSRREAENHVGEFRWLLDNAEEILADEITHKDKSSEHQIVYEPWGTVAVITPWNFPFGMAMWGIMPNLLVGNTVVFKTSEECPLMGKLVEEVMLSQSLPKGVFSEVYGAGDVGEKLARSDVNLLWFTGSTRVGKLLYRIAAEKFIKVVLEMGGSNPCIVFEDVDVKGAVGRIYRERFYNTGQVCDSIKRLIVHESVFDQVVAEMVSIMKSKRVGDPYGEKTDISCLCAKRQQELIQSQVADAVKKGAQVVTGGKIPDITGAFYEPTILTNVTRDMRVWTEEVFGPVLPIVKFKTEDEAIALANDTIYGLGSRVFSKDTERAERVAARIQAGTVEINQGDRWLPQNPFGGYKQSGMGREQGTIGLRELCQVKVVSSG